MRYTIIYNGKVKHIMAFDIQNHYREEMVIIDHTNNTYTNDGLNWQLILIDHL